MDYIKCDDYEIGPFKPISFEPKLVWKITKSLFVHHPSDLPKLIIIETRILGQRITVSSSPYSFGIFCVDGTHEDLRFGGKYRRLDTNDPEEAVYLAEKELLEWVQDWKYWYCSLEDVLK